LCEKCLTKKCGFGVGSFSIWCGFGVPLEFQESCFGETERFGEDSCAEDSVFGEVLHVGGCGCEFLGDDFLWWFEVVALLLEIAESGEWISHRGACVSDWCGGLFQGFVVVDGFECVVAEVLEDFAVSHVGARLGVGPVRSDDCELGVEF